MPLLPQARSEAQMPRSSRKQSEGTEAPSERMRQSAAPVHWKPHFSITRREAVLVTRQPAESTSSSVTLN